MQAVRIYELIFLITLNAVWTSLPLARHLLHYHACSYDCSFGFTHTCCTPHTHD